MRGAEDKPQSVVGTEEARRFSDAIDEAGRFFMGDAPVQRALVAIVQLLDAQHIAYAVAGAMAMNLHGFRRVTEDVDLVVTRDGLAALKAVALAHGYIEQSRSCIHDTRHDVRIDIVIAEERPAAVRIRHASAAIAVLPLPPLVEMKLASGMSAPHRLKDLADVVELVRRVKLPRDLPLDASVRAKYDELWSAAQTADPIAED